MANRRVSLQNANVLIGDDGRLQINVTSAPSSGGVTPALIAQDVNYNGADYRSSITIPINTPVSGAIDLSAIRPRGGSIIIPSTWDAADILFEISLDNATYIQVKDETGALLRINNITTNASFTYIFPAKLWSALPAPYIRFRSVAVAGTSNVNQTAQRSLTVLWAI